MQTRRTRRTPVIAAAALLLGLAVVGAILVVGRIGVADSTPRPTVSPSVSAVATPSSSPADPFASPEGVVRAFFLAFGKARETDDPTLVRPFVTSEESDAYLTAAGFLNGQKAAGKASILTANELSDFDIAAAGDKATVKFTHRQVGYDIDFKTKVPRESPAPLPDARVRVIVERTGGRWLVFSFENLP